MASRPACFGVFERTRCPHQRLFEEEYKRSNRNRGTKILRCFPHCCPHHVDRSYCGSSLEVSLRFGSTDTPNAPIDLDKVYVFARFETIENTSLPSSISLRYLRSVSQSEANPEASWIEGVRQTDADNQQHSQVHGQQLPSASSSCRDSEPPDSQQSATFVLNGQAFAKWYYHWESGANKVQRATKHALKAYVFYQRVDQDSQETTLQHRQQQRRSQDEQSRDRSLELLCVVTSPSFTVVSYRRAPLNEATLAGMSNALSIAAIPRYAADSINPVNAELRAIVQHQISQAFEEYKTRHQEVRAIPDESHESSNSPDFRPREEQVDSQSPRGPYDRYRRLQEREGLNFRLLTPEDAAQSGSLLHSQVMPRGPRLVFDRASRSDDIRHWRDSRRPDDDDVDEEEDCELEESERPGDAFPQRTASQQQSLLQRSSQRNEDKLRGPIGVPPSSTDPSRQIERAAMTALTRFRQQQQQLDSHQRELHQLTDLAILHFFVSNVSTSSPGGLANLEAVLTIAIAQHWRYAAGGAKDLAKLLLAVGNGGRHGSPYPGYRAMRPGDDACPKREELVLVLGEVCVWAFSAENLGLLQSLLTACHPLLLDNARSGSGDGDDGHELRTAFLDCVSRCWSALDAFLRAPRATQSTVRSVRALSDAIFGVVYGDEEFQSLRAGLRALLQRPSIVFDGGHDTSTTSTAGIRSVAPRCNLVGWRGFVAQVREGYLRDQYSGRGLPWSPAQDANAHPNGWTADWLLQPGSLLITPFDDRRALGVSRGKPLRAVPSLWTLCLALSQLLHLKIAAVGDLLQTLYIQAEPSVLPVENAWLRLICDGRVRVAPVAPNGLTSLVGGASCGFGGDYVAYRPASRGNTTNDRDNASENGPIRLEFYWWPRGRDAGADLVAFRSVVTLNTVTNGAYLEAQMRLERGFVDMQAVAAAQGSDLDLWAPTERVQSVAHWEPWVTVEGIYARK